VGWRGPVCLNHLDFLRVCPLHQSLSRLASESGPRLVIRPSRLHSRVAWRVSLTFGHGKPRVVEHDISRMDSPAPTRNIVPGTVASEVHCNLRGRSPCQPTAVFGSYNLPRGCLITVNACRRRQGEHRPGLSGCLRPRSSSCSILSGSPLAFPTSLPRLPAKTPKASVLANLEPALLVASLPFRMMNPKDSQRGVPQDA
jgi:hypothetical protein